MKKQKMRQITIKLSERQIEGLEKVAEEKGDQPLAVVIREAVHRYLKDNNKL
jgi:metal-responsive CopG/Arc/MetJ family transcriptional regulator